MEKNIMNENPTDYFGTPLFVGMSTVYPRLMCSIVYMEERVITRITDDGRVFAIEPKSGFKESKIHYPDKLVAFPENKKSYWSEIYYYYATNKWYHTFGSISHGPFDNYRECRDDLRECKKGV